MNARQANYLLTVKELGSISLAAEKLYVSQPSLSQTIQSIEKKLNVKIFDRTKNPISLTYAGEKVIEAAKDILSANTNLLREIDEINEESKGRFRIGISTHRAMHILPKILPQFMEKYPFVEVEIIEKGSSNMEELILNGKVDFAFMIVSKTEHPDLKYNLLFQEKMVLLTNKNSAFSLSHSKYEAIDFKEAEKEKFIFLRKGHGVRTIQDQLFQKSKIKPKAVLETESIEVAKRMAVALDALTIYPKSMLDEEEIKTGSIRYFPIKGDEAYQNIYLTYDKSMYLTKYMLDFMKLNEEEQKDKQHLKG